MVEWRKRKDPTCPLCKGRQTTVHVFRSHRGDTQGVLQEFAASISTIQRETNLPKTNPLIFTIPYENRKEEAHFYKRKKIPEPDQRARRGRLQSCGDARGN